MRRLLAAALLAIAAPAWSEVRCTGTPCADNTAVGVSSTLTSGTVPKAGSGNTLSDSLITDSGTRVTVATRSSFGSSVTAGSLTANFFDVIGTMPAPSSNSYGSVFQCTGTGSSGTAQQGCVLNYFPAGYTGSGSTFANYSLNGTAATGTAPFNAASDTTAMGNTGLFGETLSSTAGTNTGVHGAGFNTGSGWGIGVIGNGNGNTGPGVGGAFTSTSGATRVGLLAGYFSTNPTLVGTVALLDNAAVANPILVARDNGASLPTTGATATVTVTDGAQVQYGNGVLTNATMAAEIQGQMRSSVSSYTWTNAQVAALSGTAGDITVATLPAKTLVRNAYVVITGQAAGPTTVTVSCGDAIGGTPFINYIVASDAKVAANTVYGDAAAERGTSLDVEFYNIPSYTATTLVTCHFISTGANLSTTTGSTGRVILETVLLP